MEIELGLFRFGKSPDYTSYLYTRGMESNPYYKINQLGAQIARTSVRSVKRVIRANKRIVNNLIKTYEYYDSETNLLVGRYKIMIDDLIIDDSLYVYSDLLFEKPMLVPDKEVGFFEIQKFSFASDIDQKDVDLYTSKLVGKIKILNYEN